MYLFGLALGNASRRELTTVLGAVAIASLGLLRTIANGGRASATASSSALLKIVAPGLA